MKIDQETLHKIAHLARLEVDEKTEGEMLNSLNSVLTWMEQLNEIDTSGVQALTHMSTELNVLREDKVISRLTREQGLLNAPKCNEAYFKVPKVIE